MPLFTIGFLVLITVIIRYISQARMELLLSETRLRLLALSDRLESDIFAQMADDKDDPRGFALLNTIRGYAEHEFLDLMHLPNVLLMAAYMFKNGYHLPVPGLSDRPQWLQAYDDRVNVELGKLLMARHPFVTVSLLAVAPFFDTSRSKVEPTEEAARLVGKLQLAMAC